MKRKTVDKALVTIAAGTLALTACGPGEASADDFPEEPIEIVVPWGAGGSSDVAVRAFAEAYEEANGDQILVVNRPGGGSAIGAAEAARANADGYTMLHSTASTFITVPLLEDVNYGPDDFKSVISLGDQPVILVANPDTNWESLEDVPMDEELVIATTSPGNVLHLIASNFVDEAGGSSSHLPFDSSGETTQAVANGNADLAAVEANIALPQIEAGEVTALAVSSSEPLEELPESETFSAQGFERSHDRYSRMALSVPSDTPDEIIQALQEGGAEALETSTWNDYAETTMLQPPAYEGGDFMDSYISNETDWTRESMEPAGLEPQE
ncbi:tripartite tricarboxylate transporter substrate binding protein [Nesterenkonia sp. MY13]|uniref:Tripartite tricarboxylate transporter substrate binding protein n=1 Tax=Nesterenkonia sedimenti TaxID=1463632 RepID=A0A7X8TKZ6_9MICC|nr:tripartite tricarboxylate transporter substrate binding protein [Nesterenkonia sedimenti]NLS10707.1 tripartite tricarboxylate transporter substrate binding protein [Nesterenkonia sedimenti]